LALTLAEKVAGLTRQQAEQIADEIRAGDDPSAVVGKHTTKPSGKHKKADKALTAFLQNLERGVNDLDGRLDQMRFCLSAENAATLDRAEAIITAIRQRAETVEAADLHKEATLQSLSLQAPR